MSIKWILFILKLLEIDYKQCIILKESRFSMKSLSLQLCIIQQNLLYNKYTEFN